MEFIDVIFCIYIFMVGACFGSFSNVVVDRCINHKKMTMTERSHCCSCNHQLSLIDMIPIFSYIYLGGKCRYCKAKVEIQYLLVELLFGIASLGLFLKLGLTIELLISFILFDVLYIIYQVDSKIMEIPLKCNIIILMLGIINCLVLQNITIMSAVLGTISISSLLFILYILIPGSFGGGDIKLFFAAGCLLGIKNIIIAFMLSLIFCVIGIVIKKAKKGTQVPFGPYISLGVFISWLYGNEILMWYLSLLGGI